jgi:hypothetical protein
MTMTRYLFGRRAHGTWGANLKVSDHPPEVNKRVSSRQRTIRDWRDESGALIIARVFPEEFATELATHDARIARAEHSLQEAEAERQDFLDSVVARAKPVRLATARAESARPKRGPCRD